jgi:RNA polymerase sigma-70 factor (ECF subfamily)
MESDKFFSTRPAINAAMSEFVKRTRSTQLFFLRTMVSGAEAEEILQEAYLKIFLLVDKTSSDSSSLQQFLSLQPMLHTVVRHFAISAIRHQKVVNEHAVNSSTHFLETPHSLAGNAENMLMQNEEKYALMAAINQLPPICRQVFVQRKLQGKNHSEIAEMLGISKKTVEIHLTRGLLMCRKYMNQQKTEEAHKRANAK